MWRGLGYAAGAAGRDPREEGPEARLTRWGHRTGHWTHLDASGTLVSVGGHRWLLLVVDGEAVLVDTWARGEHDDPVVYGGRQPLAQQDWDERLYPRAIELAYALQRKLDGTDPAI